MINGGDAGHCALIGHLLLGKLTYLLKLRAPCCYHAQSPICKSAGLDVHITFSANCRFSFSNLGISVRQGCTMPRYVISQQDTQHNPPGQWKCLCIEGGYTLVFFFLTSFSVYFNAVLWKFLFRCNVQNLVLLQFRPAPRKNHQNVHLRWPNFAWCIYYTCTMRIHLSHDPQIIINAWNLSKCERK